MSVLDLYHGDQAEAMRPRPEEGRDLPATFGDTFEAAWNHGRLFGQSVSGENARLDALQDYVDDVEKKTGRNIAAGMNFGGEGGALPASMLLDQANEQVKNLPGVTPMDGDELERRAVAKSRQAGIDLADVSARERTLGGSFGLFAGGAAAAAVDPINLLALPIAPSVEGVGIVAAALRWGAVAGVSQAAIEAAGAPYREEVQPGYSESGAPLANIGEAFLGGAALGGVTKALGNLWSRYKTGVWPTSIKDAGNVLESHANVQDSNVFTGAEGESAHWDALNFAIDDVVNGRPVDVSEAITPKLVEQMRNDAAISAEREARLAEEESRRPWDALDFSFPSASARNDLQQIEKAEFPKSAERPLTNPEAVKTALDAPDHEAALRADLDRDRLSFDRSIPMDVDKDGNVVSRRVDQMLDEVDGYKAVAEQLAACAAPAAVEEAT